jgi:DNA-binding CsgD family transcriptional regulator
MSSSKQKLVERDDQLRSLQSLFGDCVRRRGRLAVISGSMGIGKTELLQACADVVAETDTVLVLTASCARPEQTLPLGVIAALLHSVDLPAEVAARAAQLLEEGAGISWSESLAGGLQQAAASLLRRLCMLLLELARTAPLMIAVDDIHHADPASLQCLLSIVRLRRRRVLVVLTEDDFPPSVYSSFHNELLRSPYCRKIRLEPLSHSGVEQVLSQDAGAAAAELAGPYHALTEGNPLLLRALIDDSRPSERAAPGQPTAGTGYAQAVLSCLYRSEPVVLQTARVCAVAGKPLPPAVCSRLLEVPAEAAARSVDALHRLGLFRAGDFLHGHARAAVLDSMLPEERAELHGRVAVFLHLSGRPVTEVAQQLVQANRIDGSWVIPALRDAAEQALIDGDTGHAVACLEQARIICTDPRQWAEVTSMLARVEWQTSPASVTRHLPGLAAAIRDGHLEGRHAIAPVNYLLWLGQVTDATDALARLCSADHIDPETARGLSVTLLALAYLFPEHAAQARHCRSLLSRAGAIPPGQAPPPRAAEVLAMMMAHSFNGDAVAAVEQLLQKTRADEAFGPISVAISALITADRLGADTAWRDPKLDEPSAPRSATWEALLQAACAELAFRQGDLVAADGHARQALAVVSSKDLGVVAGSPLAVAVLAATAAGEYDTAAEYLSLPVHADRFSTWFGLRYLHARGTYYLAVGRAQAALSDFLTCRDTVVAGGVDLPTIVPWRSDLAQAYLATGRRHQARELAYEQLRRLGEGEIHARGITLRVLAAASRPADRPPLLRQAADLLQASGDRLETAYALADLSEAFDEVGESVRARMMLSSARAAARQCNAWALFRRLHAKAPAAEPAPTPLPAVGPQELSDAERRVAGLAALGYTNREIAGKLYVTVSTVEQHLTRVYRKLRVNRRIDLPQSLLDDADSA